MAPPFMYCHPLRPLSGLEERCSTLFEHTRHLIRYVTTVFIDLSDHVVPAAAIAMPDEPSESPALVLRAQDEQIRWALLLAQKSRSGPRERREHGNLPVLRRQRERHVEGVVKA